MKPSLRRFGRGQHPVVVVDDFTSNLPAIVAMAAALAPFPEATGTYYPGRRRMIGNKDGAAFAYADKVLRDAATFICGAFDLDAFTWAEASFSMVTTPPHALLPPQRAPHFDSPDPKYLAVLHYLSPTAGTAFYRQRSTGIELVGPANLPTFVKEACRVADRATGYIHQADDNYEQIGLVEGIPDRLVIYRGALLHSGIITPGTTLSADPLDGRLTANLFVKGR